MRYSLRRTTAWSERALGVVMSNSITKPLLESLYTLMGRPPIQLAVPGGMSLGPPRAKAAGRVIIKDSRTLLRLIVEPNIGFGDAYSEGRIEVEGDLVSAICAVFTSMPKSRLREWFSRRLERWLDRVQANTLRGSRRNIRRHYDLTTEFYKLWLDRQMVYTCAYFPTPSVGLEEAQVAKMDHVCRKLQLQPGETVVEAGCGWGALALHMAKFYGVSVRAYNISRAQIAFARRRVEEQGLARYVEFIEDDYRNISGDADVFVSVGMLEHVGADHYRELGNVIHRVVGDSGRGLLHFIGRNRPAGLNPWIRKRIFPGGYTPSLAQALGVLAPWDFSVFDVENLRFHYAKTLEHWLDRFERSADQVSAMYGPQFVRTWRLYLAGSVGAFLAGTMQLFQIVFAGRACRQIPWTRAHLYAGEPQVQQGQRWMHATS
jgi:cyclopropane-fatty-acyl-phospholipid synthase